MPGTCPRATLRVLAAVMLAAALPVFGCADGTGGGGAVGPVETAPPEPTVSPPGDEGSSEGAALVEERCSVCHSLDRVLGADKDRREWTATVDRMIGVHGADLDERERSIVIDHLAGRGVR